MEDSFKGKRLMADETGEQPVKVEATIDKRAVSQEGKRKRKTEKNGSANLCDVRNNNCGLGENQKQIPIFKKASLSVDSAHKNGWDSSSDDEDEMGLSEVKNPQGLLELALQKHEDYFEQGDLCKSVLQIPLIRKLKKIVRRKVKVTQPTQSKMDFWQVTPCSPLPPGLEAYPNLSALPISLGMPCPSDVLMLQLLPVAPILDKAKNLPMPRLMTRCALNDFCIQKDQKRAYSA